VGLWEGGAAARDGSSTSGDLWVCGAYFVHGQLSATGGTNGNEPTEEKAGDQNSEQWQRERGGG
jgi:hypothetical protein